MHATVITSYSIHYTKLYEISYMRAFKKYNLLILVICLILLTAACAKGEPIATDIGSFEYSQEFMQSIDDTVAQDGNTLLVIYLKPIDGANVDLDAARNNFV